MSNQLQEYMQPQETMLANLAPKNLHEAMQLAEMLASSNIVPKDFIGKPANILVAMQWGAELGLQTMQAMQSIAVINGRPSLWGDAVIALARSSPLCEYIYESDDGTTATCKVKRRGEEEQIRTFSVDDAKSAGLHGKGGPWTQYPKRMRQMRARAFALRDVFPDVLRGLSVAEEAQDMPEVDMGKAEVVNRQEPKSTEQIQESLPVYDDEKFASLLAQWSGIVEEGRSTAERILTMAKSKASITPDQEAKILALGKEPEPQPQQQQQ